LIANVARDAFANRHDLIQLAGEVGFAACCPSEPIEHARIPIRIVCIGNADRIDKRAGLSSHLQKLGQLVPACVVAAIADNDQRFLTPAARLRSLQRLDDRVLKRRHSFGRCPGDRAFEFLGAISEPYRVRQAQSYFLVEVDYEHLVFRVARVDKSPGCGDHMRKLRLHAPAVIDYQTHRHWNIFVPEQPDGLPDTVFVNSKVLLAQIGDRAASTVASGSMQHPEVDTHGKFVWSSVLTFASRRKLRFGSARETDEEMYRESEDDRDARR
jgi:hypothetical protein